MDTPAHQAVEILPNLWLGNLQSALSYEFIQGHCITCVINCTEDCPFIDLPGLKKIRVPLRDTGSTQAMKNMYLLLDRSATAIYRLLPKFRILIHCYAGRQRSVSIILAFLMKYAGFSLQEALDTLRSKKPQIGINFSKALVQYQLDLYKLTGEEPI